MTSTDVYTEYKSNLYTKAMGCVRDENGSNVFADAIPLEVVRARFATESVNFYRTAYVQDGTDPNGLDDVTVVDPARQTTVRKNDGRIHGTFGIETNRRQYEFLLDTLTPGVTGESVGDLKCVAAGTTRNGGRAYMQFSTAAIQEVRGMHFASFYTVGMSHDGSLAVTSTLGNSIIECANMVQGILGGGKGSAKSRQTKNVTDLNIVTAHTIKLGLEWQDAAFAKAIEELHDVKVSDAVWSTFVERLAPITEETSKAGTTRNENMRATLTALWNSDPRVAPWHGTALGALQAVNTFDLWERGTRGDTSSEVRMTDELLSGKLAVREANRAELLKAVLVAA